LAELLSEIKAKCLNDNQTYRLRIYDYGGNRRIIPSQANLNDLPDDFVNALNLRFL
jgi:hypothetical protein